ncbi:major head protein [Aeromonas phage BUCT551]|uniref:Major capsid protein n=2 Tax=Sharonstreetvirus TaxID=2943019 RepID=A0AAF0C122_9CAUD|nr:major head protein [Aeromonas phage BUCT551]QOI69675.1 putative major capsid protein [Aeromonas phage BUCT551]UIS24825.1 major capsid protein [Aeromonas phage pAEv1812]WCZ66087.1 major capsid protein [Aeromonas phage phiA034]
MAGLYPTETLVATQQKVEGIKAFWLALYPNQINFDTDIISFEKVSINYKRLAPFVAPNNQGKILREQGFRKSGFKPAYLKPKHVVDPHLIIPVQPGERPGTGTKSLGQRRAAVITHLLQVHRTLHENRWEWMAAKAAIYGYVDVSGEAYPTQRVDFGRDASLTSTNDWTAAGATPLKDIYNMRRKAKDLSLNGVTITRIIFGQDAWDKFIAKEAATLEKLWDKNTGGGTSDVTRLYDGFEGLEYLGSIRGSQGGGRLEFWINTQKYTDEQLQGQYLMPQNGVFGWSEGLQGYRCFGAIMDPEAGYQAMEMYPSNWREKDPAVEYLMSQGAPLMVPADANASFLILT